MGWVERNGRRYYYRKRREGRRVISEYIGGGTIAELYAVIDELKRDADYKEWQAERRELEQWLEVDREITQALDVCSDLVDLALILAGCHTHKGQWRRYDSGRLTR